MLNANTDSSKGSNVAKYDKIPKKAHDPDEMRKNLLPLIDKLYHQEDSISFREPVNPEAPGIPVRYLSATRFDKILQALNGVSGLL